MTNLASAPSRTLLSGNEAVALAARDAGVALGTGYPGTPATEILEHLDALGGRAQWAPNEKVALEVALGAAFGSAAALVAMKHVGLNVAADPLFVAAYTGVAGALVIVAADDPGMASSQNEQDSRRYAVAAGVPMLEPADSQEAYDFTLAAFELSRRWHLPVLLRMTTRICHAKTLVNVSGTLRVPLANGTRSVPDTLGSFQRDIPGRVMVPMHARPAHRRLRAKLAEIAAWNESCPLNRQIVPGTLRVPTPASGYPNGTPTNAARRCPVPDTLGIVASGVTVMHVREAAPEATMLKLAVTYPLPLDLIRRFVASVGRCLVVEENDPYLFEQIRAAGIAVEQKAEMYRFGELNVGRVRRIIAGDLSPETPPPPGKPPALCERCPHRVAFGALRSLDCIVAGDIGCYTLGALPPLGAMDSQLCMGASIGMGLGLRHVLPEPQARRVVSVIGDSTFLHSGIPGLVEMVYNPPPTGHVVLVLDNGTTAMTGLQEHPGTGRTLGRQPTGRVVIEDLARSLGIGNVLVIDPVADAGRLEVALRDALARSELTVIVVRRPCLLAAARDARAGKGEKGEKSEKGEKGGEGEKGSANSPPLPPGEGRGKGECACGPLQPAEHALTPAPSPKGLGEALGRPVSVVIAGLGGQGVLTASDILAEAAVLAGCDVKKADVHGMSQRGGSVASDVRFGPLVLSPMVPPGEADFLVVLAEDQVDNNRPRLRESGVLIAPAAIRSAPLPDHRSANVALLGVLSRHLDIDPAIWREAIRKHLKPELYEVNCRAFDLGRGEGP
jgi:indolepyruvate ferredoxin oxidoreductase alpha subunit